MISWLIRIYKGQYCVISCYLNDKLINYSNLNYAFVKKKNEQASDKVWYNKKDLSYINLKN